MILVLVNQKHTHTHTHTHSLSLSCFDYNVISVYINFNKYVKTCNVFTNLASQKSFLKIQYYVNSYKENEKAKNKYQGSLLIKTKCNDQENTRILIARGYRSIT